MALFWLSSTPSAINSTLSISGYVFEMQSECVESFIKSNLMAFIRNFLQLNTRNYNPVYSCFSYLQCFLYLDRCLKCFNVVNYSFLQNQQKKQLTSLFIEIFMPYLAGLEGMCCLKLHLLLKATNCSSTERSVGGRERGSILVNGLQTWSKNPWKQQVCPWPACVLRLLVC